jgi:hypothetical protein
MQNFNQIVSLADTLTAQAENYSTRPTKAESKRMRDTINDMKKLATSAKQDLLTADKG